MSRILFPCVLLATRGERERYTKYILERLLAAQQRAARYAVNPLLNNSYEERPFILRELDRARVCDS